MKRTITLFALLVFSLKAHSQAVCDSLVSPCVETNSGSGFYLELEAASNTLIESFATLSQNSGTVDVQIHYKQGTYVGFESNDAAWTSVGTTTGFSPVTALSCPIPATTIPIPVNICLVAGQRYSFYIFKNGGGASMEFSKQIPEGDTVVSDGTLTLYSGKGTADFVAFQGSFLRDSGSFQGNIQYSCGCTPSSINSNSNSLTVTAYPVPAKDFVTFNWNTSQEKNTIMKIYTTDGKLTEEQQLPLQATSYQLNTSNYKPGNYLFVLYKDNNPVTRTLFIKE